IGRKCGNAVSERPPIIDEEEARTIEVEVLPPEPARERGHGDQRGSFSRPKTGSHVRCRFALGLAILVDAVQIGLFPLFAPGFASVANIALDTSVFLIFWLLIG